MVAREGETKNNGSNVRELSIGQCEEEDSYIGWGKGECSAENRLRMKHKD